MEKEKKSGNEIENLRMTQNEFHSIIMEMKISFIPNFPYIFFRFVHSLTELSFVRFTLVSIVEGSLSHIVQFFSFY